MEKIETSSSVTKKKVEQLQSAGLDGSEFQAPEKRKRDGINLPRRHNELNRRLGKRILFSPTIFNLLQWPEIGWKKEHCLILSQFAYVEFLGRRFISFREFVYAQLIELGKMVSHSKVDASFTPTGYGWSAAQVINYEMPLGFQCVATERKPKIRNFTNWDIKMR